MISCNNARESHWTGGNQRVRFASNPNDALMISLRTLGRPSIDGADDASLAAVRSRPKLLALLAYLVLAAPEGRHRRDALLALFWPESDESHARTSLRSALYQLRSAIGTSVIRTIGDDDVAVDLAAFDCDALALERDLAAKQLTAAVTRYTGHLLDGLYVMDAPDFERWLERRRALLHARVADAADALADASLGVGDMDGARRWAERALELDPVSERAFLRLVRVTASAGDRARVTAIADDWELAVRDATGEAPPRPAREIAMEAMREVEDPPIAVTVSAAEPSVQQAAAAAQASLRPTFEVERRRRRTASGVALGAAIVMAAAAAAFWRGGFSAGNPVDDAVRRGASRSDEPGGSGADPVAAFAEGERMMHAGRIGAAVDAFGRAVALDSSFALASYRLGIAASWNDQGDLSRSAIDASLRHADRLTDDERLLARAQRYYLNTEADSAYALLRRVLAHRPEQLEGWLQLGEVTFHYGPLLGIPPDSAERAFARALLLAPNDLSALHHLLRLRARRGASPTLDALVSRTLAMGPDVPRTLEIRAIHAAVRGDEPSVAAIEADPQIAGDFALVLVPMVATSSLRFDVAERFARHAGVAWMGVPNARAIQVEMELALLDLGRGDTVAFERHRRAVGQTSRGRSLELNAVRLILPQTVAPRAALAQVAAQLGARDESDASSGPSRDQIVLQGIYPPRRMWLRAMLLVRLGDVAGARGLVDTLADWRIGNAGDREFARTYARVVRAQLLMNGGDAAGALAALEAPGAQPNHTLPDIMSAPKAHERWLRIVALSALRRDDEARAWAAGFPDPQGYDVAYVPAVRAWLERGGAVAH